MESLSDDAQIHDLARPVRVAFSVGRRLRARRPTFDAVADRLLLTTYAEKYTTASGLNTLAWAIQQSNGNPGPANVIAFDTAGSSSTINLSTPLPAITQPVTFDGTTQSGYTGTPIVQVVGSAGATDGLDVTAGGLTIKRLIISGFSDAGIILGATTGGDSVTISYIGTNAAASAAQGNGTGIRINSPNNTSGGTATGSLDLISGYSGNDQLTFTSDNLAGTELGDQTSTGTTTLIVTPLARSPTITTANTQTSALTITPGNAATGTVKFQITGVTNGSLFQSDGITSVPLNSYVDVDVATGSAVVKFTPSPNFIGQASFTVQGYDANGRMDGTPGTGTINVMQLSSTTTLTVSPSSPAYGQTVTFAATVSPPTSTGTVAFTYGSTTTQPLPLANGTASYSTSSLAVGGYSVTAQYSGDTITQGSPSSSTTVTVGKATTTTSLAVSPEAPTYGQTATLTATVSPASAGGTVTFYVGQTSLGNAPLSSDGTATLATADLPGGSDSITASYGGDANDGTSSSIPSPSRSSPRPRPRR
jgi:hypothetical protein